MEENEKPPVFLEPPPPKDIETILFQLTTGPGRDIGEEFSRITTSDFPREELSRSNTPDHGRRKAEEYCGCSR